MKQYPSITKDIRKDVYIYAFDKLDGNNIRAQWTSKRGFYKFGSRHQLIDENNEQFGEAISLVRDKYENDLNIIFKKNRWRDVVCFFEYFGPNSFAGRHNPDDIKTVVLLDVNPYKEGILEPKAFIKLFKHLDIPKVLYEGSVNSILIDSVKNSLLDGMTFEGVVCKGANGKKTKIPTMFKIKSLAWLEKLRAYCNGDLRLFEELS